MSSRRPRVLAVAGWALVMCAAQGCGRSAPESSPAAAESASPAPTNVDPAAAKEPTVTDPAVPPMRSPYALADAALARLIAGAALPGRPADLTLPADAKIEGLYFQDRGRTIAALIRPASAGQPALWLEIVRGEGGFVLNGVRRTEADPDLSVEVEGG